MKGKEGYTIKKAEEECIMLNSLSKAGVPITPQIQVGVCTGLKAIRTANHKENFDRKHANQRGMNSTEISIMGEPHEIAVLVVGLQGRQVEGSKPALETIKEAVASAIRGIEQAERMKEENLSPL